MEDAHDLEEIANKKNPKIPIVEPFSESFTDGSKPLLYWVHRSIMRNYCLIIGNVAQRKCQSVENGSCVIKEAVNWVAEIGS